MDIGDVGSAEVIGGRLTLLKQKVNELNEGWNELAKGMYLDPEGRLRWANGQLITREEMMTKTTVTTTASSRPHQGSHQEWNHIEQLLREVSGFLLISDVDPLLF